MTKLLIALVAATLLGGCGGGEEWRLYRSSTVLGVKPLHIATFDSAESGDYNKESCAYTRNLYAAQSGLKVSFWCEKAPRWAI